MRNDSAARVLFLAVLLFSSLVNPPASDAHPMGNFSISHYAGIRVNSGFVEMYYLIDMAEIPTYQEIQNTGTVELENPAKTKWAGHTDSEGVFRFTWEAITRPVQAHISVEASGYSTVDNYSLLTDERIIELSKN